ncbi:MAG TPA: hypothetical protein VFO10_19540 [Oligoflexus sp.]|uniref:hypothetical protein n=1 Tax=Oligoflexus sp. TaxID=1971216 RepID=UPI002D80CD7C|nr:hypothetical protein [Oligoflexus sp.]HET9239465.1 hypothetical protein [Oligoflexus sp.]
MRCKATVLPFLIVSGLSVQCVTSRIGTTIDNGNNVKIECKYLTLGRNTGSSEVECIIENTGSKPETIGFEKVSLSDPSSTILPVNSKKIPQGPNLQPVVVVLGVIVILGTLAVLASKGKSSYIPSVHLRIPDFPQAVQKATIQSDNHKPFSIDTIQVAAHGSASLIFKIKHNAVRPKAVILHLRDVERNLIEVPIKETILGPKGRSNFDY